MIVDDFIGTGGTMCRRLREHRDEIAHAIARTGRSGMLAVVAGFESAICRVTEEAEKLGLDLTVAVLDVLDESDMAFNPSSSVFERDELRLEARQMVDEIGRDLGSDKPLGTGDCEPLVVFEHNTPNNTLAIIWKASVSPPWTPLFARAAAA